jgi:hypothetical protein
MVKHVPFKHYYLGSNPEGLKISFILKIKIGFWCIL